MNPEWSMIESRVLTPGQVEMAIECEDEEPRIFEIAGGRAALITHSGPGRGRPNEDAGVLISLGPETAVIAVADGAGGMPAGGAASRLALEALVSSLTGADPNRLRIAILDGIEAANGKIMARSNGSATTLLVAEIHKGHVRTYHAGDSAALVAGQRGRLKLLTVSHSPTGYAYESGLFDELEAAEHPDRHLVNNMLGIPELRVEIGSPLLLAPRDTLLLASDGLFDNLLLEEVIGLVCTGPLHEATADLYRRCRDHMEDGIGAPPAHPDDLVLIAFRPAAQSTRLTILPPA